MRLGRLATNLPTGSPKTRKSRDYTGLDICFLLQGK
jgi:hypothetical protein